MDDNSKRKRDAIRQIVDILEEIDLATVEAILDFVQEVA